MIVSVNFRLRYRGGDDYVAEDLTSAIFEKADEHFERLVEYNPNYQWLIDNGVNQLN